MHASRLHNHTFKSPCILRVLTRNSFLRDVQERQGVWPHQTRIRCANTNASRMSTFTDRFAPIKPIYSESSYKPV